MILKTVLLIFQRLICIKNHKFVTLLKKATWGRVGSDFRSSASVSLRLTLAASLLTLILIVNIFMDGHIHVQNEADDSDSTMADYLRMTCDPD